MTGNENKNSKIVVIGAIVLLIVILSALGFAITKFVLPKFTAKAESVTVTPEITQQTQIDIGSQNDLDVIVPVYPGATAVEPPSNVPVTDTRTFFATPDDADAVTNWYRSELNRVGYIETDSYYEGDVNVIRFENEQTAIDLFVTNVTDDGTTGFSLIATRRAGETVAGKPPVVEATPDITPPTVPSPSASADRITANVSAQTGLTQLTITASVPSLPAGTLTKYTYDVILTGYATATITPDIEIVLPDGIALVPDESGAYDHDPYQIRYQPSKRTVTYAAPLAPGQVRRVMLTVVTDMFIKSGNLFLKGYLSVPDEDKQLTVHQLVVTGND